MLLEDQVESFTENSVVLSIFKPDLPLLDKMITSLENQTCKSALFVRHDEVLNEHANYSSLFENVEVNYDYEFGHFGHASSYSYLLQNVNSRYIHFADQDDYWFPEKTERAQQNLGSEEGIRLSYCRYEKSYLGKRIRSKQVKSFNDSRVTFIFRNKVPGCTMSFTRETNLLYREVVKEFYQIKHHDWLMILIASLYGSVIRDNYVGVKYNIHSNNAIGIPSWKRKVLTYTTQKYSQQVCPYWVIQGRAVLRSIKISNSNTLFLESCIKAHSKNRRERITFLLANGPLKASFIDIFYLLLLFVFPKKCSSCGGGTRNV